MSFRDTLLSHMNKSLGFEPTPCQSRLFEALADFTVEPVRDSFILVVSGYAGTGKTSAISSYIKTLQYLGRRFKLVAPTGRSAKVLSSYSGQKASTIHKLIYRQKSMNEGIGKFSLDFNKDRDTVYIVDECSLIQISDSGRNEYSSLFGSGDTLNDLVQYVSGCTSSTGNSFHFDNGNKIVLVGDPAQLPPIGFDRSPALDADYLRSCFNAVVRVELKSVVRQKQQSGILANATMLRHLIEGEENPAFDAGASFSSGEIKLNENFPDVERVSGGELIEKLTECVDKYGLDNVVVLCRSNNRANRYNNGIRQSVLFREEQLVKGDKLMVVKNCYQFVDDSGQLDFIANGDVAELVKISDFEERYNLHFAQATMEFPDYDNVSVKAKIILDTLTSTTASLGAQEQSELYKGVYADWEMSIGRNKRRIMKEVREDRYYNALQVKYATAITGHKSQGGQWKCVFIDNPFWGNEITLDDKKWLYTAITRGVEKVFFVNFKDYLFV